MAHPLDEYPIHQAPVSMRYPATSDRDFYDRNIFQVIPHGQAEMQLISGYGVYPNLGVKDAYVCVRHGTEQHVLRASDALDEDRMTMNVGPMRVEVLEPLRKVRFVCDDERVGIDAVWSASVPVHDEAHHSARIGDRLMIEASRFVGLGHWEGECWAGDQRWELDREQWTGTRDRSWGIRPVGEQPGPGRWSAELPSEFYWFWIPLRFEEFSTMVILQEKGDGTRILNDAVRLHPLAAGRAAEQLGWPRVEVTYQPGTRLPTAARVHLSERDGTPLTIDIEVLGSMPLHVGCGYGGDSDWGHGQWRGRNWVEYQPYDLADPAIRARFPWGVIDHSARATFTDRDGRTHVGYGIFEHGTVGVHLPSGFTDLMSVSP